MKPASVQSAAVEYIRPLATTQRPLRMFDTHRAIIVARPERGAHPCAMKPALRAATRVWRAATSNAEFLHIQKDPATVETGKLADLVLLDANPLEQIANTQRIAAVVADGRYFPAPERRTLLDRAALIVKRLELPCRHRKRSP